MNSSDNPFTIAYRGEELLNNPTLLPSLANDGNHDAINAVVDTAWNAFMSHQSVERWHAFSQVLIAADAMGLPGEDLIRHGRKWAASLPDIDENWTPIPAVIEMFKPHLDAAGKAAVDAATR